MLANVVFNTLTKPPTAYPQVTVGGVPLELRFSLNSSFFIEEKLNIPTQELPDWITKQVLDRKINSMLRVMTASMLGREVKAADGTLEWEPTPMMPDDLTRKCSEAEWVKIMGLYTEAITKVAAAMKEAVEKQMALQSPPQTSEPEPIVN